MALVFYFLSALSSYSFLFNILFHGYNVFSYLSEDITVFGFCIFFCSLHCLFASTTCVCLFWPFSSVLETSFKYLVICD